MKPSGEESAAGVPPEGTAEPSSVDIEEVKEDSPEVSEPMDT